MRFALVLLVLFTNACVIAPSYQFFRGGETISQPGVSFTLPEDRRWAAMMRTTYQVALGADGMRKNETLLVATSVYKAPEFADKQEFLAAFQKQRTEPLTTRFEILSHSETLYEQRPETCAVYKSVSKDFGAEAKRGGEYSIFETYGIYCIHPLDSKVAIMVELSRKAPPHMIFPEFEPMAQRIFSSVKFGAF